jgi:hypothetical protein
MRPISEPAASLVEHTLALALKWSDADHTDTSVDRTGVCALGWHDG